MKKAIGAGVGFGIGSGIVTTLGLMIGLAVSTSQKDIVINGVLIIAILDALSDSFGMHISQESNKIIKERDVWRSTFSTFVFKFIVAISFLLPVIFFSLNVALIVSIIWGVLLLSFFSIYMANIRDVSVKAVVFEHLFLLLLVVFVTFFIGKLLG
ncbi:hypothetical protein J4436_00160 [Candidatus Woesearchaeota archaeon]|nr:hypothetical protein [Candidatus Woesearchaeota archaeon]